MAHGSITPAPYAAPVRRAVLAIVVVALAAAGAGTGSPLTRTASAERSTDVFAGLSTWIDVYDTSLYRSPATLVARLAERGVRTVYVETANDRSTVDVVQPAALGRLVEALHAGGISAVAWYLPGFDDPARDTRRALAMLRFRTPAGDEFDGVGLDVESLRTKNAVLRTKRLLALVARVRAEAGDRPLAAITYPSRAFERHLTWWPSFPWSGLAAQVDAFIPMLYTGGGFKGYDATYGYVARSLRLLRASIGDELPVHAAGGVANRMSAEELKAFVDALSDDGTVTGWSLYDLQTTTAAGWKALEPLANGTGGG